MGSSASTSRRSGERGPSRCCWPTTSSSERGRMRTASGAEGSRAGAAPSSSGASNSELTPSDATRASLLAALPPTYSSASARAAGLTRAQLRGSRFLRLSHDLVVRLDDAIDARERLQLLARVLPPDAACSHLTAAAVLGAHVDAPARAHVALTPRPVLPQRAEFVVHARRLQPED